MAGGGMHESNDERSPGPTGEDPSQLTDDDPSQPTGGDASQPTGGDALQLKREQALQALFRRAEDLHTRISALQREQLSVWATIDDACDDWETYGAGDTAHYVSM